MIINDINLSLIKKKKSSKSDNIKKNFLIKKKLIKVNLLKKILKKNDKLISKFSFYESNIKLKKINNEFKYFDK